MLEQIDRFILLVVHEQEVVLLNLVAHQEEDEGEEGTNRHGDGEDQRHGHDSERERLIIA